MDGEPPYREYDIFREGHGDVPPNNWRSFFSGKRVAGNYPDTDRLLRPYEAVVYRCTLVTNP